MPKRLLRIAIIVLSIFAFSATPSSVTAGPFEDLFRSIRRAIREADARQHHPTKIRKRTKSAETSTAERTASRNVNQPPNSENIRSAKATAKKATNEDLRYGIPVPGKDGFVTSPFSPNSGYVDVRGFPPGTQVRDPYSGKTFLTP